LEKTTVSVNLASALSAHGRQAGLLDLDIHGPSIPKMLGIEDQKPENSPFFQGYMIGIRWSASLRLNHISRNCSKRFQPGSHCSSEKLYRKP